MFERVFVDTNCFIHLRDLKDLPWTELFPGMRSLEIVIAQAVIDELDSIKNSKTGRTRDRSRMALSLIEEISSKKNMSMEIRSVPYKIVIKINQRYKIEWDRYPRLDPIRADDVLIAEMVSDSNSATLVSNDLGPIIRARSMDLQAVRAPEGWTLPSPRDDADLKISKLEKDLAQAKSTKPNIEVRFTDQNAAGEIVCHVPLLEPIPEATKMAILRRAAEVYPRKKIRTIEDSFYTAGLQVIANHEANKYYKEYDSFIEKLKNQINDLHKLLYNAFKWMDIRFSFENNSNVTATNLRIEMSCAGNYIMCSSRSALEAYGGSIGRIAPPNEPKSAADDYLRARGLEPPLFHKVTPRDPVRFYWVENPTGKNRGVFVCDEFRPMKVWEDVFYVRGSNLNKGSVSLEITATNLPAPVELEAEFRSQENVSLWSDERILRRLPDWMSDVIRREIH